MNRHAASVLLVAGMFVAACGAAHSTDETASAASDHLIQGPHIANGTSMQVRLTQALDLSSSSDRAVISAVLENDLRTPNGDILVRSGAALHGHIAWSARTGRISLRDAQIESPVGPLDIHAALIGAGQPDTTAAPTAFRGAPNDLPRGSAPLARQAGNAAPDSLRGLIACDAAITLQLTRPLLAPGASVLSQ